MLGLRGALPHGFWGPSSGPYPCLSSTSLNKLPAGAPPLIWFSKIGLVSVIQSALTSYSLPGLPARDQVFKPMHFCVTIHSQPIRTPRSSGVCSLNLSSLPDAGSSRPEAPEFSAPRRCSRPEAPEFSAPCRWPHCHCGTPLWPSSHLFTVMGDITVTSSSGCSKRLTCCAEEHNIQCQKGSLCSSVLCL